MKNILFTILILQAFTTHSWALNTEDVLPFSGKHLVYPEFEQDQLAITSYLESNCLAKEDLLDPSIKEAYLIACQFPKLLAELKNQTQKVNELLASNELVIRTDAQFLDLEFGWATQDLFSLMSHPETHIVNLLILRRAVQASVPSISKLWLKQHGRSAQQALFLTLPKFAAAMERDLLLTRTLQYANAIRCINLPESACLSKRAELKQVLNANLMEYQKMEVRPTLILEEYFSVSANFRKQLNEWLNQNSNPIQMLKAVHNNSSTENLMATYREILRLPKRSGNDQLGQVVEKVNVLRYLHEQNLISDIENDYPTDRAVTVTASVITILNKVNKQMEKFFPSTIQN